MGRFLNSRHNLHLSWYKQLINVRLSLSEWRNWSCKRHLLSKIITPFIGQKLPWLFPSLFSLASSPSLFPSEVLQCWNPAAWAQLFMAPHFMPYSCLFRHSWLAGNIKNFGNMVLILCWQTCLNAIHINRAKNFLDPPQPVLMDCLKSWIYFLGVE